MITKLMMGQRQRAYAQNLDNIISCLNRNPEAVLCDLGCDDGKWTMRLAEAVCTKRLFGVELIEERRKQAEANGITASSADLNQPLPYDRSCFDIIHANQVIEHLSEIDLFLAEIYRTLKPGGYVVISTENLASWHNIFALTLGYMPFSLTNTTSKIAALGNPLAPHTNEAFWESATWHHKTVFTTKGLVHLLQLHGFQINAIKGAGYYPLGSLFATADPYHCAFITIRATKA
jgi:2-polyprenyl-3-methyl-5-hydroxy-6-metoxy-1,4-benzoquinol methylase